MSDYLIEVEAPIELGAKQNGLGVGPQGPQGERGDDGLSAYGVAVANGYTGTEEEWLLTLVGEQGPAGPEGPQGPGVNETAVANINHSASLKTSLVDTDEITGQNSASSFSLIRTTWTSVKAFLKAYFDGLYLGISSKASDSDKLDGYDSTDFASASHNHTGTYAPVTHNHNATDVNQDSTHRFVTEGEKSTWSGKQDSLGFTAENVSNKKTTLTDSDTDYPTTKAVNSGLSGKQNTMTKAAGSDITTGMDDVKYVTSKAIADAGGLGSGALTVDSDEIIFNLINSYRL